MIVAILITVFALGGVWIYLIPLLQSAVPASFSANKWAQIAITGGFLLIAVWIVGFVVKAVGVKEAA
jgi:hypothetical protein